MGEAAGVHSAAYSSATAGTISVLPPLSAASIANFGDGLGLGRHCCFWAGEGAKKFETNPAPSPALASRTKAAAAASAAAEAAETDVTELLPLLPLLLPLADPGEAQPWRLCPPSERPELKTAPQLVHANLAPGWCGFAVLSLLAFRIADLGRFV